MYEDASITHLISQNYVYSKLNVIRTSEGIVQMCPIIIHIFKDSWIGIRKIYAYRDR